MLLNNAGGVLSGEYVAALSKGGVRAMGGVFSGEQGAVVRGGVRKGGLLSGDCRVFRREAIVQWQRDTLRMRTPLLSTVDSNNIVYTKI